MRLSRELSQWGAGLLIGIALGALVAASAAGQSFAPSVWFWPLTLGCGIAGVSLGGVWLWVIHEEIEYQQSEALDIDFTGQGTDSVYMFPVSLNLDPNTINFPPPVSPAMLVRLRVRNLRGRQLDLVRVTVKEIGRSDGGAMPQHHVDVLKWMHDDTPDHSESIRGLTLEPGSHRYIDLATKFLPVDYFWVDYARSHLRDHYTLPVGTYMFRLQGTSRDAQSRQPTPPCESAFQLSMNSDGQLVVQPLSGSY